MLEDEAASTPSTRRSPTPQPPPPRRSPTPLPTPPRRSPTPPPPPPTKKPSKRPAPQTKNQSPPAKKATVKPRAIPKIISEEKEEGTDAYKKDMSRFYDKLKMNQEARRNPEKPYFFVAPDILRKKVTSYQHQQRESRKPSKSTLSDYDRTLTKSIEAAQKKKRAGKGVAQLGQQAHQSIPPLVVGNEYGSNLGLMHQANIPPDVDLDHLGEFLDETGLDLYQMFGDGNIESAAEVDIWKKKFVLGQSLYNPQALSDLGTQMYLLNKWYMQASTSGDFCVGVRIRDEHWFRGDDVMYVDFAEFHQLCHLTSLDKAIISCYCL
jgi:hypothetical protein